MSQTAKGALIIVGSGPGIGRNVAALFASRGFGKVVLMSRNAQRLEEDKAFVLSIAAGADVTNVPVDLGDSAHVQRALAEVGKLLEGDAVECVLFNAARLGMSKMMDFPAEDLERDLRISVVSLYAVVQWAMPQLLRLAASPDHNPALLVTSGFLYKDPFPQMFSLASCKAAQFSLLTSLHKEYEPQGVHCAAVPVGGRVSDEAEVTSARNVAEEMWKLYSQPKGKGRLCVEMRDPDYEKHIRSRER